MRYVAAVSSEEQRPGWAQERFMRIAIAEAEKARGKTGDNPWVGCAIVDDAGTVLGVGHTQGPGEDHAEIGAIAEARARGADLSRTVLYSTLEPCSFHGRTPACSRAIVTAGFKRVVTGIRDPNPRVDGAGKQILLDAGIAVVEYVCAREITHQLGSWILAHHPHEPLRRARTLAASAGSRARLLELLAAHYGVETSAIEPVIAALELD
jgi:diaminohydroxyphosphoribosylaminopyrimidine deaminase/5-amino-6-(5-phosphoribosylamino)uracil reductase